MKELERMYEDLGVSRAVYAYGEEILDCLKPRFAAIDQNAEYNQAKVLHAMQENRVDATCFAATTGYGYDDLGRETLDKIYAEIFGTEAALVRIGFVNGTHALTAAMFALVKPGDTIVAVTGMPYDTLRSAIGISGDCHGSLKFYGINYAQVNLAADGGPDYAAIAEAASKPNVTAVMIQRSRGYDNRNALSVDEIGRICETVKAVADHYRNRRRKSEGAGAADNEHGYPARERKADAPAEQQPYDEGDYCNGYDCRDEHAGDLIGDLCYRRFCRGGFADHFDDLAEGRILADAQCAAADIAGLVHGRGGDLISLGLVDGDTLACQCRFIDRAAAPDDNAVNGDALARTHGENIVLLELLYRYHALSVALDYRGGLG